tara:strand:+ start:49 stop:783 length:735 start_codon:yes stop_codon:yes gene_type:complete
VKLYNGDCLEVMQDIPDNSIDFILTDLPYGTTACKWDNIIPYKPMWEQLKRIRKDNTAIALFGTEPFSSHLRLSNLNEFKYDWYWQKSNTPNFMQSKVMPLKNIENILIFSNGKLFNRKNFKNNMFYYPQNLKIANKIKNKNRGKTNEMLYKRPSQKGTFISKYKNYPKTLLKYDNESKSLHPTQKPIALLEYLIKTYTLENETVLDFTMGSGSTGVACVNTNRDFIGIELDKDYFNIAKERIG